MSPPYTIVGGNLANMIRKRFDAATIVHILEIQWCNWSPEKVQESLSQKMSGNLYARLIVA